jgi:rhodanese-related sulfurtransferase
VNSIPQIRPSQLSQWVDSVQQFGEPIVLDVREPGELAIASIQANGFGFKAIPMGIIPTQLTELNPSQPIACMCHHGARSMQVAMYLKNQGFSHVVNIAGGIHAWSAEVDPTVPCY